MKRSAVVLASAVALAAALGLYLAEGRRSEPSSSAVSADKPVINKAALPPVPAAPNAALLAEVKALGDAPPMAQRLQLVEKLAALGPGHEQTLVSALVGVRSSPARGVLSDALARIGTSEAVDALLGVINSTGNAQERADILPALDALPAGHAIETLASSLTLKMDPQVREAVVSTISRAADGSTVQFLNELCHEPEAFPGQSAGIVAALGDIRSPAAAPALGQLLTDSHEISIMSSAASSLGRIGTVEALEPIAQALRALGSTNPDLRKQLLSAVQGVNNPDALPWLQRTASSKGDAELSASAQFALKNLSALAR